jgi:hypothetical protein
VNRIRLLFALGFAGVLCAVFSINGALEARWRDALEGGVPALLLLVGAAFAGRSLMRRR